MTEDGTNLGATELSLGAAKHAFASKQLMSDDMMEQIENQRVFLGDGERRAATTTGMLGKASRNDNASLTADE